MEKKIIQTVKRPLVSKTKSTQTTESISCRVIA